MASKYGKKIELEAMNQDELPTGTTSAAMLYASGSDANTRIYVKKGANTQQEVLVDQVPISLTWSAAQDLNDQVLTNANIDSGDISGADITVGSGKTLDVSGGTLTTSAAQNLAILQGAGSNVDIGAYEMRAQTFESDVSTGTAPFTIASTTKVANLNVDQLDGADWASPAAIGSDTAAAGIFTTLYVSSSMTASNGLRVVGNLEVDGDINSVNTFSTDLHVQDKVIVIASGSTAAASDRSGIMIGDKDSPHASMLWKNPEDRWEFGEAVYMTGALELASTLTVAGNATFNGNVTLGEAADSVSCLASLTASNDSRFLGTTLFVGQLTASNGMNASSVATDELSAGTISTSGLVSLGSTVQMPGVTDTALDVSADSFYFLDGDGTVKRDSMVDYATAIAGDGLAASAGALSVGVDDSSIETNSDALRVKALGITNAMLAGSIADSKLNQITTGDKVAGSAVELQSNKGLADSSGLGVVLDSAGGLEFNGSDGIRLEAAVAGDGLAHSSGVLSVNVDDSSIETNSDSLRVKALGITNAMLAGSIVASKMNNAIFADLETLGAAGSDGQFIVATGAGAFAYESGATVRTSLGLGTGDAVTFAGITSTSDVQITGSVQIDGDLELPNDHDVKARSFVTYSDRELKTNIQPMNNALDKVMKLEAVSYDLKAGKKNEIGFIAQDVAKVVPEICALDTNGIGRGIDYSRMSTLLVGALKAQQEQIAQLKEIVAKLQK